MKERNVTVYIDVANLICTSKDVNITYDLEKLLKYFVYKYEANKCIYFTTYFKEFEDEYNKLKSIGVEIVFRELSRSGGKVKTDCDVDIANRITLDVEYKKTDEVVLVTCDGDFGNLLDYVKNKIDHVRLFAVAESKTSKLLKKRQYLDIVYLEDVVEAIQKGKGPAIHARIEGTLFDNLSITATQNLSSGSIYTAKVVERKVRKEFFEMILLGKKKFENRLGDLDIKEGDTLLLKEVEEGKYTGREIPKKVLYVHHYNPKNYHWSLEDILDKGLITISFE